MKYVVAVAFACNCLVLPASAQQLVKQLLPTPPKGDKLEARLTTATIQPGAVGNWHTYPNHPVVYVAEGTVTVEFRDGEPKVFGAGEGFRRAGQPGTQGEEQRAHTRQAGDFQLSPPEVPDAVDAPCTPGRLLIRLPPGGQRSGHEFPYPV